MEVPPADPTHPDAGSGPNDRVAFLAEALDDVQDGAYIKGPDGRYLMVNSRGASFLGRDRQAVIGLTDRDLFGAAGERIWEADREILASGTPQTREDVVVIRDRLHTFVSSKAPLRDSDGRVIGLLGISTDISDRADLEERVRRSEALLVEAQEVANVGSWEWDLVSGSHLWSPQFRRILGLPQEDADGLSHERFLAAIHRDDRSMVERELRRTLARATPCSFVHRIVRPDGDERLVITRGRLRFDVDRLPTQMVGATLDMTEYQRVADELRTRQIQLSEAEELARTGGFSWEIETDSLTWTDGLCRIYGREPSDFPRTLAGFLELVHPEDREARRRTIEAALPANGTLTGRFRIRRPDGAIRLIESRSRFIRDESGQPVRLTGACMDVTDLEPQS